MNTQNLDCFYHLEAEKMKTFRREKGSIVLSYNDHHITVLSYRPEHCAATAICAAEVEWHQTSHKMANHSSPPDPWFGISTPSAVQTKGTFLVPTSASPVPGPASLTDSHLPLTLLLVLPPWTRRNLYPPDGRS